MTSYFFDLSLAIGDENYAVTPRTAGTNSDGYRLTKLGDPDPAQHLVSRDAGGMLACTCADFRLRRTGATPCKHVLALAMLGILGPTNRIDAATSAASPAATSAPPIVCKASGVAYRNAGGEHRQDVIKRNLAPGVELEPRRDPRNPFDANAVGLWATLVAGGGGDKALAGYLPAEVAREVSPAIAAGRECTVFVSAITGGFEGALYGLTLHVFIER